MHTLKRLHCVLFDSVDHLLPAIEVLRHAGYVIADVHAPFAIHGIDAAMGLKPTRLPWATLCGAATGASLALGFQSFVHIESWPMNIGGKTLLALPALVPVTFELAVLFAAFATVATLLFKARLSPFFHKHAGLVHTQPHPGVTDGLFAVIVCESDAQFCMRDFRALCFQLGARHVDDGWRVL